MIPWLQQVINRIGKNDDAAAMNTTLFAGQQKIADDIAGLNDLSAADINAEVDSALNTAAPASPTAGSLLDILSKAAGGNTFDKATDSLEAIRDRIDAIGGKSSQAYTSGSGNWTVPSGIVTADVLIVGGGGGGAGCAAGGNASGGGGGEVIAVTNLPVTPGADIAYVVGAGGNGGSAGNNSGIAGGSSSFGAFSASGGNPGLNTGYGGNGGGGMGGLGGAQDNHGANASSANGVFVAKVGGGGGGGKYTATLTRGGASLGEGGTAGYGGGGGGSYRSGANGRATQGAGDAAAANSGGGGGGASDQGGTTARAGGNGGSGYILIIWG